MTIFDAIEADIFWWPLQTFVCIFFVIVFSKWVNRKKSKVPPGSMGWPYIGDNVNHYSQDPNSFYNGLRKRYGNVFKTHILGCSSVMVASPDLIKDVLVTKADLFKPTYPPTKEKFIGPAALFFHQGEYHSMLKKLVQASFVPSVLKTSVANIERIVVELLLTMENKTINTLTEMKRIAFEVAMCSVFGHGRDTDKDLKGIKDLYSTLEKGYNCMPTNAPGLFLSAVEARELINKTIRKVIDRRRNDKTYGAGLLGVLLQSQDEKNDLTDLQVADNIIGVIFAAHDTTASVLTWILKYMHDNEDVLDAVTLEQEKIRDKLVKENRHLMWEDTRNMPSTNRVINETLRCATIISFTFREAVNDVEFEGYVIPKGWKVLPLFRAVHHSEGFFSEPEKFDPSRFEEPFRPNTFMPFGTGGHSCPGSDLAKLEILIVVHHLTTKYRWEVVGGEEGIEYLPFPVPKAGLPLKITLKEE